MSAETLRQAAALMRERAENILSDPDLRIEWTAEIHDDGRAWVNSHQGHALAMHGYPSAAEHIASWHPTVALAVADWLTYVADTHDETACPAMVAAEQVARAYLGEDA